MEKMTCIGAMSGTSLDGLDLALVELKMKKPEKWDYKLLETHKVPFSGELLRRLENPRSLNGQDQALLDRELGRFIGDAVRSCIDLEKADPLLIASHGHTLHHRPKRNLTFQIGYGGAIAAKTGVPVVSDFRGADIEYGGQGAPLVPIGDELLFGDYDKCLNLGGFANYSYRENGERKAADICPVNTVLNHVSQKLGEEYDRNGEMAREGNVDQDMLKALEGLTFYSSEERRSLGREWLEEHFLPLIDERLPEKDQLRTLCEHIAIRIAERSENVPGKKNLVTGGGAFNWFLLERIQEHAPNQKLVLPNDETIDSKEAIVFALLGALRWKGMPNSLRGATGADRDVINGAVHRPSPSA